MNKCLLTITVSALSLACSNFAVASPLDTSHIHTQHTLGLKPISSLADSFNLAAATFLPDYDEKYGFNRDKLEDNVAVRDNCSGFALSSCPAHAKCSKCSFGNKYKITGCETDYKQSGNACVAKTCSEINAAYKAEVPANQVCTITKTSVRSCYSSCRTVNTSGYPLDTCPSGAVCTSAPDCGTTSTTKGSCAPLKQKVTGCTSSAQKVNSTATACIDKDDTCPATYYKSCDTGTQGAPKYTEKGSACYQCKPACIPLTGDNISTCTMGYATVSDGCDGTRNICNKCEDHRSILYSDHTISTEYIASKTPIAVVLNCDKKYAIALQEDSFWGWQEDNNFLDIPTLANCTDEKKCPADGKDNTEKILAFGKSRGITYGPAEYCYNYQPQGCSADSWCGKGNWYLPSVAQAPTYASISLNDTFGKIPKQYKKLRSIYAYDGGFTSNEYSKTQFWENSAYLGLNRPSDKHWENTVTKARPFINF